MLSRDSRRHPRLCSFAPRATASVPPSVPRMGPAAHLEAPLPLPGPPIAPAPIARRLPLVELAELAPGAAHRHVEAVPPPIAPPHRQGAGARLRTIPDAPRTRNHTRNEALRLWPSDARTLRTAPYL